MPTSVADTLHDAIIDVIDGLGLVLGTSAASVVKRKFDTSPEGLSQMTDEPQLPRIVVSCSQRPDRSVRWDTGKGSNPSRRKNDYMYGVGITAASNHDTGSNLDTYQEWRQKIARALGERSTLEDTDLGSSKLYDVDVDPEPRYRSDLFLNNYDRTRLTVMCSVIEPALGA